MLLRFHLIACFGILQSSILCTQSHHTTYLNEYFCSVSHNDSLQPICCICQDEEDDPTPQNVVCVRRDDENNVSAAAGAPHPASPAGRGEGPQLPCDRNWWKDRTLRQLADDQEFGTQFTAWFYAKLNNAANAADSFGIEHFFNDATLALLVNAAGHDNSVEHFEGAELVVRRLMALIANEQLVLNANQSEDGVRGMSDPHGRRVVFVCGTVHRENAVLGLFEQQFGLVRDPSAENNWKICFTRLALSTRTPSQLPTLAMTQHMLTA